VKIHGKEHKLHGPCCATFWDLSSYKTLREKSILAFRRIVGYT
jgi:hypothetical protein